MKLNELSKEDLELLEIGYSKFKKFSTFEDFVENMVRRCECCGNLVIVDYEDDLPLVQNWDGEYYKCCSNCEPAMYKSRWELRIDE